MQKKKMRILKNKQNENFINEKQWEKFEKTKNEHFEKEKKMKISKSLERFFRWKNLKGKDENLES